MQKTKHREIKATQKASVRDGIWTLAVWLYKDAPVYHDIMVWKLSDVINVKNMALIIFNIVNKNSHIWINSEPRPIVGVMCRAHSFPHFKVTGLEPIPSIQLVSIL